jgi:hypothetical protein
MRPLAFLLLLLTAATACVLEDKPVDPGGDGGVDGGICNPSCADETPVCNADSECVECTATDQVYCTDSMRVCKTGAFECVDCNTSAECTDADAAHCNASTNECEACVDDADCVGIDGLPRCEDTTETCVQCTPDTEAEDCSTTSCNPDTFTCTTTEVGSVGTCEECVADSECGEAGQPSTQHRCVEMFFPVGERFPDEQTGFCLKVFSQGGCEQPYAIRISDGQSVSGGSPQSYCGINETVATCSAVRALQENQVCPTGEDTQCPESGLCRDVGGLPNRCTYHCASVVECLEDLPQGRPGSTCGSSGPGSDDYCGG